MIQSVLNSLTYKAENKPEPPLDATTFDPWPHYKFSGRLRPFPQTPKRTTPPRITQPDYAIHPQGLPLSEQSLKGSNQVRALNEDEIDAVRLSSRLARDVMEEVSTVIGPGISSDEVDRVVHEACVERDAYPSPLNYNEFPGSAYISVNEVLCYGIPDTRVLKNGDVCSIEVALFHRGFHASLCETFLLGTVEDRYRNLAKSAYDTTMKAIDIIKPGEKYKEIGAAVQKYAQINGHSIIKTYNGQGIHRLYHTCPTVPHYGKNRAIGVMKTGHAFTVCPILTVGSGKDEVWPDKFTTVSCDGAYGVQFGHTVLVTDLGYEVLTKKRTGGGRPYFMGN